MPDRRGRLAFLAVIVVLVGLTLSRTSLLAIGLVGVWIVTSRRLSPVANIAVIAALLYALGRSLDYLRLIGPFAERAGSDALRDRIVELERLQISQHPWLGNGPGTSTVLVDGQPFFFHNSYLALQNEGGWVAVAIFVVLGLTTLSSLARLPRTTRTLWLEGGIIAVATCAANLGEVLLELPTAIVIGAAVLELSRARQAHPESPGQAAPRHPRRRA
jgi:O-antigen ligase